MVITCCHRRRDGDSMITDQWERVVEKLRRLKFKRRCWAFLGHHLNYLKQRGRILCGH